MVEFREHSHPEPKDEALGKSLSSQQSMHASKSAVSAQTVVSTTTYEQPHSSFTMMALSKPAPVQHASHASSSDSDTHEVEKP